MLGFGLGLGFGSGSWLPGLKKGTAAMHSLSVSTVPSAHFSAALERTTYELRGRLAVEGVLVVANLVVVVVVLRVLVSVVLVGSTHAHVRRRSEDVLSSQTFSTELHDWSSR